jgi:hypothetical protein
LLIDERSELFIPTGIHMAYTPAIGRNFWYQFDLATQYNPDFMKIIFRAGGFAIQNDYRTMRRNGTYPAVFKQKFLPHKDDWIRIADLQTVTVGRILGGGWSDIQAAFEDFGQGTLLDDDPQRKADNNSIHMMDAQDDSPPIGYHRWHASLRAIQLLDIGDRDWWENLDRLVGLAWAIQSFAKPKQQDAANPAVAAADLQDLRNAWLALTPDRRDHQYDLAAGAVGYHPSPKQPG